MRPISIIRLVTDENIARAEAVLTDNGIADGEASTVLQALGYALLGEELYPEITEDAA